MKIKGHRKLINSQCIHNHPALGHVKHVTHLTQLSNKVRWAFTHEAVQHCVAVGTVLAWPAVTFIPLDFTVSADKSWRTLAVVTFCALLNNTQRKIKSQMVQRTFINTPNYIEVENSVSHTLHVAPFWHWPWQRLMSEEDRKHNILSLNSNNNMSFHIGIIYLKCGMCTD